jgi:mRNA interferase MazF
MEINRGDVVVIALPGDYGKPRPALVVQADAFLGLQSVTVLRLTSDLHDAPLVRIDVQPDTRNGLRQRSQVISARKDRATSRFSRYFRDADC